MAPVNPTRGMGDLDILYPEQRATIAGRAVVMREYSFAETLQLAQPIAALSDALTGVAMAQAFHDMDSLRGAFGAQGDAMLTLIAAACDQPRPWVAQLSGNDGESLMLMWWGVNYAFFLRRVLTSVQLLKARQLQEAGGVTSSPASSPLDMTRDSSPSTRTVN